MFAEDALSGGAEVAAGAARGFSARRGPPTDQSQPGSRACRRGTWADELALGSCAAGKTGHMWPHVRARPPLPPPPRGRMRHGGSIQKERHLLEGLCSKRHANGASRPRAGTMRGTPVGYDLSPGRLAGCEGKTTQAMMKKDFAL